MRHSGGIAPLSVHPVSRWPQDGQTSDLLAAEVPVALEFNGISHAVMLATPLDLEAFALGFALTEGILDTPAQCYGIEVEPANTDTVHGLTVKLDIASSCFQRLKLQRRSLAGNTGCGLCGVESLAALGPPLLAMQRQPWLAELTVEALLRASNALAGRQVLNQECGSLHAAAWVSPQGDLIEVMEDVGRHNALDKLLGHRARQNTLQEPGLVLMTSRASHELIRKCVRMGVGAMAAISAPTDFAVDIAHRSGLQLWGLVRGDRAVRYTA
jgi:FdhD protein